MHDFIINIYLNIFIISIKNLVKTQPEGAILIGLNFNRSESGWDTNFEKTRFGPIVGDML